VQNLVFMGMGEPLDNFEHVTQAIRVFAEPAGMDFPHTQITVSTVGRIDGLRKLAALRWTNLRIAISLNAAQDRLRDELMPINKGMPLAELQRALLEYPLAKKGRFLIEYVLIKGVNDSLADADAVAAWCQPLPCIVNLIPYNPQRYASFETPGEETISAFLFRLKEQGIFVKRRITHGRELMGACGQLGNPEIKRRPLA
jgi:23S rRNA (adenine2503-C2)-methyltransferase